MTPEVQELIASNGDVRLAAERLSCSVHELTVKLMSSPDLMGAIQTSINLQLLDLVSNYKVALVAAMGDMSPKDLARSFRELLDAYLEINSEPQAVGPALYMVQVVDDAGSARERLGSKIASVLSAAAGDVA